MRFQVQHLLVAYEMEARRRVDHEAGGDPSVATGMMGSGRRISRRAMNQVEGTARQSGAEACGARCGRASWSVQWSKRPGLIFIVYITKKLIHL
jgi:hypothetical protein